jgi:membrane protease YdiL (CAAX protease family)
VALWGTALLFAATHHNAATFLPLTLLAIVLARLYEKTNNLLAPIITHSMFNAMNFLVLYLVQQKSGHAGW